MKNFYKTYAIHINWFIIAVLGTILFSLTAFFIIGFIYCLHGHIKSKQSLNKSPFAFFATLHVLPIIISLSIYNYGNPEHINVNVYNSDTTYVLYKDSIINSKRISCDSISVNKFLYHDRYKKFTRYNINIEGIIFAGILNSINDSIAINDSVIGNFYYSQYQPLEVDGFKCGDTLKKIERKPYWDRDLSLLKITKKYVNSNWAVESTTEYKNKSSEINDYELYNIFNNVRAEYRYDKYIKKYTLQMMDETKVDTLEYESDAITLLEAKCKDKAMIDNKLKYSEFEACKNNNSIKTIKILTRPVCGYSKVNLEYERGAVSSTPIKCFNKPNYGWTYE